MIKCPECGFQIKKTLRGGTWGVCGNIKCHVDTWELEDKQKIKTEDRNAHSKSYNNSGRG
jgi:hypothetical protein